MKLIKKAKSIDVKRAFVITPYLRELGLAGKYDVKPPTRGDYLAAQKKAVRIVRKLKEKELDKIIGRWKARLHVYNSAEWFVGTISPKEVGVWKGAGGLPIAWTAGPLDETAKKVGDALKTGSKGIKARARRAIPAIIQLKSVLKKEKYLMPIIFHSEFGNTGRRGLRKTKYRIDDGNMRSIAYVVSGDKKIKTFIGLKRKSGHARAA